MERSDWGDAPISEGSPRKMGGGGGLLMVKVLLLVKLGMLLKPVVIVVVVAWLIAISLLPLLKNGMK